ncbi:hypothetical protein IU438_00415 [Nocardia cyriacigeorgica]|uniref:hypothetical protein n=1 Tax=Nocardia cyriacigeorgica TaxID=135487 RepID=UPI0018949068|nr:hypothetical protein [Nocardia cyriacigeorgica]MBF6092104.1 hypothetical protein [Nocardia cyriacigeorgica]MBF6100051.1 hypothetical protein [Nocardia cyriacigeorgica]MBF6159236.1 hypothetical protein [Nocardia cyriacigeorgica]MBF6198319.1 hypothetical protein [Nocardia cyriacigeorgica]MBF6394249.1 hypothetical protein [Nocardia cyriacigeorgica]
MSTDDAASDADAVQDGATTGSAGDAEPAEATTPAPDGDAESTDAAGKAGAAKADEGKASAEDADKTVKAEPAAADATPEGDKAAGAADSGTAGTADDPDKTVKADKVAAATDEGKTVKVEKADKGDKTDKTGKAKATTAGDDKTVKVRTPAAAEAAGAKRRNPLFIAAGVAVVLAIAAAIAGVVFFLQSGNRQDELDTRAAATKAACDFGNQFATYSGDKVDDYLGRLEDTATGEWKKMVAQLGPDLKARFEGRQVDSRADEVMCGYASGDEENATLVLVIDQTFSTADVPNSTPGKVRVAANVEMKKENGRWLVAQFDFPAMQ